MSDPSRHPDSIDQPDLDTGVARQYLRAPPLSKETLYRLGKRGEIESYLLAGCRIWRRQSLQAFKERQINKGPQFSQPPTTGAKRKPGRPPKPATTVKAEA